jgi:hypothetical protein
LLAGIENFKKDSDNIKVETDQKRQRLEIMKGDIDKFEDKLSKA